MISIVVPCYNCEKTIKRTVESILEQTVKDWRMILIDDGSTDSTPLICDEYSQKDLRIESIHQQNKGLMNAWKRGVTESDAEYIAFCDSDDYYDKDFIERMESILTDHPVDILAFGLIREYPDGKTENSGNSFRGYFQKSDLDNEIIPNLFPSPYRGEWSVLQTRVTKVYSHKLLDRIMSDLSDQVSQGEDNLTVFASLLNADSLYVLDDYMPYHYVRNDESMIGRYDKGWFDKLTLLHRELSGLALKYGFKKQNETGLDYICNTLVYIKKEILRSGRSNDELVRVMEKVRSNPELSQVLDGIKLSRLSGKMRVFAHIFASGQFRMMIGMVKISNAIGVGRP